MHRTLPRAACLIISAFLAAATLAGAGEIIRPVPSDAQVTRFTRFNIRYSLRDVVADGVAKVEFYITDDMGGTWRLYGEDADKTSPMTVQVPGEGVYGFVSVVTDKFGNHEREPGPRTVPETVIVVDRTAPTAKWLAPLQNTLGKGQPVNLSWEAHDSYFGPGPVKIQYAMNAKSNHDREAVWNTLAENLSAKGSHSWMPPADAVGSFNFRLVAEDRAGNLAVAYNPSTITVDNQPPQITGVSPLKSNKLKVDVKVDADDGPGGSGVKEISLYTTSNQGGSWTLVKERSDTGESVPVKRASGQTILFEAPQPGSYGLWPVAFDEAGNGSALPPVGAIGPYQLVIDTEPPIVTLSNSFLQGRSAVLASDQRRVDWTGYDPHLRENSAAISLSLDNGQNWQELRSFLPTSGSEIITFPFGSQSEEAKLRVTVADEFGNIGEGISETFKLSPAGTYIDNVTPVGQTPSAPTDVYGTPTTPQYPTTTYPTPAPASDPYRDWGALAPAPASDPYATGESTAGSFPRSMMEGAQTGAGQSPYLPAPTQVPSQPSSIPPLYTEPPAAPVAPVPAPTPPSAGTGWQPSPGAGATPPAPTQTLRPDAVWQPSQPATPSTPAPSLPSLPSTAATPAAPPTDLSPGLPPLSMPSLAGSDTAPALPPISAPPSPPAAPAPAAPATPPAATTPPAPSSTPFGSDWPSDFGGGLQPPSLPPMGDGSAPSLPPLQTPSLGDQAASPFSGQELSLPPLPGAPAAPSAPAPASAAPTAPSTPSAPPAVAQTPASPSLPSGGLRPPGTSVAPPATAQPAPGAAALPPIQSFPDSLQAPPLDTGASGRPVNKRQESEHYVTESKGYLDEGRVDLALDSATKALNADDTNPKAFSSLSQAYVQQDPPNFARAATLAKEATKLGREWDTWWNCADVFYRWAHARNRTIQAQLRAGQNPPADLVDERNQALNNAQIAIGNSAMLVAQGATDTDRKQVAITQGEITYLRALTIPEPVKPNFDSGPAMDDYRRAYAAYKASVTPVLLEALPYFQTAMRLDGAPSYRETFHLGIINFRLGGLERESGNSAQAATYYTEAAKYLEEATTAKAVPSEGPREAYYMLAYCHDQLAEQPGPNRARHKELALRYWRQTAEFYPPGTAYRDYAGQRLDALSKELGQ